MFLILIDNIVIGYGEMGNVLTIEHQTLETTIKETDLNIV